jgi:hypothetical protein
MTREFENRVLAYFGGVTSLLALLIALGLGATVAVAITAAVIGFWVGVKTGVRLRPGKP